MALFRSIRQRAVVGWFMAAVLLAPLLLGLLPSPVSAEEQALFRDLQISRCLEQGLPMPDVGQDCDHCILVTPQALPRVVVQFDPLAAFEHPAQTAKVSFQFVALNRARLAAIVIPDPGRGPPV